MLQPDAAEPQTRFSMLRRRVRALATTKQGPCAHLRRCVCACACVCARERVHVSVSVSVSGCVCVCVCASACVDVRMCGRWTVLRADQVVEHELRHLLIDQPRSPVRLAGGRPTPRRGSPSLAGGAPPLPGLRRCGGRSLPVDSVVPRRLGAATVRDAAQRSAALAGGRRGCRGAEAARRCQSRAPASSSRSPCRRRPLTPARRKPLKPLSRAEPRSLSGYTSR
jgi:hypothetical protein